MIYLVAFILVIIGLACFAWGQSHAWRRMQEREREN